MTSRRLLLREGAIGGAERVLWGRDGDSGAAVAVANGTVSLNVAGTQLMGVARVVLLLIVAVVAYAAWNAYSVR